MMSRLKQTRVVISAGFVSVCLVLAAALPVSAQTARTVSPEAGPRRLPARLLATPYRPLVLQLRKVRLTPQQRERITAILKAHRPDLKAVADKARTARQGWQQAGKIDIQERNSLNEQRQAVMQAVRTEIFNVLTPGQKAQIQRRLRRGR